MPTTEATDTTVIMLNTATFEMTRQPAQPGQPTLWVVTRVYRTQSANARALTGLTFDVGRDPWSWPMGYACRVQQAVNAL